MDVNKKIELLRRRNALLLEENQALKEQISRQNSNEDRHSHLLEQLEILKEKWEQEIAGVKELKMRYEALIGKVKKTKDVFMEK